MTINALLVKQILMKWRNFDWQIQGLGMLRLYLSERVRLHLWNPSLTYAGNSVIHTHPWDFESEVICGELHNVIYSFSLVPGPDGYNYSCQKLFCGPGGGLIGTSRGVTLREERTTVLLSSGRYTQTFEEIHKTKARSGTVSIVTRTFRSDKDHAFVLWPVNEQWTSAEPRPAKAHEVYETIQLCLRELESVCEST